MMAYVIIAVVVAWFAGAVGTVYAGWLAVDRLCWKKRMDDQEEVETHMEEYERKLKEVFRRAGVTPRHNEKKRCLRK